MWKGPGGVVKWYYLYIHMYRVKGREIEFSPGYMYICMFVCRVVAFINKKKNDPSIFYIFTFRRQCRYSQIYNTANVDIFNPHLFYWNCLTALGIS
jgi:hypothetical protein